MKSTQSHPHRGNSCIVQNVSHFPHSTLKTATSSFRTTTNSVQVLFFVCGSGSRKVILALSEVQILFCAPASKRNTKLKMTSEMAIGIF